MVLYDSSMGVWIGYVRIIRSWFSWSHRLKYDRLILLALVIVGIIGVSFLKHSELEPVQATEFKSIDSSPDEFRKRDRTQFAYVFYVASSDYSCYALVNAHRLIFDLNADSKIDIVILTTKESRIERLCPESRCPFPEGRIKLRMISQDIVKLGATLTNNVYYMDSYVRFEAFGLFEEYDKLVILDSDGLIMRNMDHLFYLDLGGHNVAAALAHYIAYPWISSILLVVEPSKRLYDQLKSFLTPVEIDKVAAVSNGAHFDMDILNYALNRGNLTKRLSKYYALLDSYFFDDHSQVQRRQNELSVTYYVHFTFKKPLEYIETRPWPLEVNASDLNNDSTAPPSGVYGFPEAVYVPFWKAFDRYCRTLVQKIPTVPPAEKHAGIAYPDPDSMMEYINNSSDLIIVHM